MIKVLKEILQVLKEINKHLEVIAYPEMPKWKLDLDKKNQTK